MTTYPLCYKSLNYRKYDGKSRLPKNSKLSVYVYEEIRIITGSTSNKIDEEKLLGHI